VQVGARRGHSGVRSLISPPLSLAFTYFLRGKPNPPRKPDPTRKMPIQETDPLPKIELIGTDTRRVADGTARQETLLPGRDGFMGRAPDQTPWWNPFPLCSCHRTSGDLIVKDILTQSTRHGLAARLVREGSLITTIVALTSRSDSF
jgi:hypothetical protein